MYIDNTLHLPLDICSTRKHVAQIIERKAYFTRMLPEDLCYLQESNHGRRRATLQVQHELL